MATGAVNVTTSTTAVREYTRHRKSILLINVSDTDIYVKFGEAAVVAEGILLNADGGSYRSSREDGNLDVRAINAIHAGTGDKVLTWTEYP